MVMKTKRKNNGSVMLMAVYVIAMMSALVIGMLQMNTEEIQLMQNHVNLAGAVVTAEAGLNDAFYELRNDSSWTTGFTDKAFNGGTYTVTVSGTLPTLTVQSTGTSAQSFVARVEADVTVSTSSPYIIRVDNLRVNE